MPGIELGPGNTAENQTDRSKRERVFLSVVSELELQLWPSLAF